MGYLSELFEKYKRGEIELDDEVYYAGFIFRFPETAHVHAIRAWCWDSGLKDLFPREFMKATIIRDHTSEVLLSTRNHATDEKLLDVVPIRVALIPGEPRATESEYNTPRLVVVCNSEKLARRTSQLEKMGFKLLQEINDDETYITVKQNPNESDYNTLHENFGALIEVVPYVRLLTEKWYPY